MARKIVDNPASPENDAGRDSLANYLSMGEGGFLVSVGGSALHLRRSQHEVMAAAAAVARAAGRQAEEGSDRNHVSRLITGAEILANLGLLLHEEADHQEGR